MSYENSVYFAAFWDKLIRVNAMKTKKYLYASGAGVLVGLVNGMLGAGGGMITVPLLKKMGLDQKKAHANAVAVILPITLVSAVMYIWKDYVELGSALIYLPTGIIGALVGTWILKRISPLWLKRIFGIFMVYAGVRLLVR